IAVLKQTSPTAWPSAPRPKPSSTVPSASTRSAVGLRSGQAEAFSDVVMSASHRPAIAPRQSRNARIHTSIRDLTRTAGILICGAALRRNFLKIQPFDGGGYDGSYAGAADSGPGQL